MKRTGVLVCLCIYAGAAGRAGPVSPFDAAPPIEVVAPISEAAAAGFPLDALGSSEAPQMTDLQPVPEPAVILSMGSGLLALAGYWRRRMRRRESAKRDA